MEIITNIVLLLASVAVLTYGAELALETSEKIGKMLGLSSLVVGLILVGLGTSLPEFFVSHISCLKGVTDLALGNILGSNLANMFFILGVAGVLMEINVSGSVLKAQFIIHLFLSLLLAALFSMAQFHFLWAFALEGVFCFFLIHTFLDLKKRNLNADTPPLEESPSNNANKAFPHLAIMFVKLIFGFALLYAGGELMVYSGVKLAKILNISEFVVSVILVAFGTSLPELVTTIIACVKKKNTDIIIGNIVGSNIFNASFVLGSLGGYSIRFPRPFTVETSILTVGALFLFSIHLLNKKFHRKCGFFFLLIYSFLIYYWCR